MGMKIKNKKKFKSAFKTINNNCTKKNKRDDKTFVGCMYGRRGGGGFKINIIIIVISFAHFIM